MPAQPAPSLLVLILFSICIAVLISSCGKPTPKRMVERYLEEITKHEINQARIESLTSEGFRDKLRQNEMLAGIMDSGGNYYDLFARHMSDEDSRLVENEFDFNITYQENIEGSIALVTVFAQPLPKKGVKTQKALASETLHPLLKTVLSEKMKLEFKFILKLTDENWKIRDIIFPGILDEVMREHSSTTVTLPLPDDTEPEPPGVAGDDA